ncbi:isochorismatase family protein [Demequina lutea]|uniref:Nicotinamidase-related amidase n=1 Tax=Demequina lutea TaxID=431489 RepID=A0A7Y9ZDM2_9MICO|nr:isochorismatase family protein [Demequina lutea]NYI41426.1 nicotinamidase-related amidase [Demequina lutea]
MTILDNRPHSAVVVIDVQVDVMAAAHERANVIASIGTLVERARESQVPVFWVQHSDADMAQGSEGWRIVPELSQQPDEPVVHKRYGDAFEDTTLEDELLKRGIGRLVIAGAQTDACVRSTLHGAFTRGYDVTLVHDAHTTEDLSSWGAPPPAQVIAHTNLYWAHQTAPGRVAAVGSAAGVEFAS